MIHWSRTTDRVEALVLVLAVVVSLFCPRRSLLPSRNRGP